MGRLGSPRSSYGGNLGGVVFCNNTGCRFYRYLCLFNAVVRMANRYLPPTLHRCYCYFCAISVSLVSSRQAYRRILNA